MSCWIPIRGERWDVHISTEPIKHGWKATANFTARTIVISVADEEPFSLLSGLVLALQMVEKRQHGEGWKDSATIKQAQRDYWNRGFEEAARKIMAEPDAPPKPAKKPRGRKGGSQ